MPSSDSGLASCFLKDFSRCGSGEVEECFQTNNIKNTKKRLCEHLFLISKFTILIQIPMVFFCVYMQPGAMGGDEVIFFFLMRSFACQTVSKYESVCAYACVYKTVINVWPDVLA